MIVLPKKLGTFTHYDVENSLSNGFKYISLTPFVK